MIIQKTDFNGAVNALKEMARNICVNVIPDNVVFIKCYPFDHSIDNIHQYEYNCFIKGEGYSVEQIIDDILQFEEKGENLSCVDLTLYYVTATISYVLVELIFSEEPSEVTFHCGIRTKRLDTNQAKFDLNEYVDSFVNQ